jgi:hypothetical protein
MQPKVNTMLALVQAKASRFASLRAIEPRFRLIKTPSNPAVRVIGAVPPLEQHEFPETFTWQPLPVVIRDETLDFYAFVFCQGGFHQLGMTFEQFLLVAAAIRPADLPADPRGSVAALSSRYSSA